MEVSKEVRIFAFAFDITSMNELDNIQDHIYVIRGQRVMLDFDLATLYEVETKALNQAVKRNSKRFEGDDFMFQLTTSEWKFFTNPNTRSQIVTKENPQLPKEENLRSQIVTSRFPDKWGGNRRPPYAFTEIGVAMLSSILRSEVAIQANRKIMRAFVAYRHLAELPLAATYLELRKQIEDIKSEMNDILADQNDINESTRAQLDAISDALAELQGANSQSANTKKRRPIGFIQQEDDEDS